MKTAHLRGLLEEVRRSADGTHQQLVTYGHNPIHTADVRRWRKRRTA